MSSAHDEEDTMNEFQYHSPGQRADLAARHESVRRAVAASRRTRPSDKPASPQHGGIAALAALFGTQPRHRAV
jgi:hypothetical protein